MSVRKTRNDSEFSYCLMNPSVSHAVIDANGNETGEIIADYLAAMSMWANVSPATGVYQAEQFGNLENYDKVIVTRDMSCPIDENTLLFIDKNPEYVSVATHRIEAGQTPRIVTEYYSLPKNDYIVQRVAKSLNSISIAVSKVKVG